MRRSRGGGDGRVRRGGSRRWEEWRGGCEKIKGGEGEEKMRRGGGRRRGGCVGEETEE